jgi:trans-aconitate 2-methyltransferase
MSDGFRWDPVQYVRYAEERGRPFNDLIARIGIDDPRRVVDLGCGPGALTSTLAARWPNATITGVDSSVHMIKAAREYAAPGRLEFVHGDIRRWKPPGTVDLVVANAVLHWVPDHLDLVGDIAAWLAPAGALAFQVPDNFAAPSHLIIHELRVSPTWRDRLAAGADDDAAVESPATYLTALAEAGLVPDVWQTEYLHLLPADNAVLEWIKGTALRPVLDALAGDPSATQRFLDDCGASLLEAYPPGPYGTVFPFRRTFAIGRRPAATAR